MAEILLPLGRAIREYRESLAISQEKLADRCGFDRTYISMLERGRRNPTLINLIRLAKGLETPVSHLLKVYDGIDADQ
jgi:transcriptional regulator with XRE-family HTH domain